MENFKNYVDLMSHIEKTGSVLIPENFAWMKDIAKSLPNINLDLPTVERKGKIQIFMDKKNPIYVQLSDGTKLYFTYDQYKRIKGKPEKGKTMIVRMQRLQNDKSNLPSQISSCEVI